MFRDLNILNLKFENLLMLSFRLTIRTFLSNLQEIARHGFNLVVPSHSGLIIHFHSPTVNLTSIHYIHRTTIVYDYDSSGYERSRHVTRGNNTSNSRIIGFNAFNQVGLQLNISILFL